MTVPIYEYRCQTCAKAFEVLTRHGTKASCPSCQGKELERLWSVFAVNASPTKDCAVRDGDAGGCGHCGDQPGRCGVA